MADRLRVQGIEFYGFHGVPASEREVGHRFRAEVELELDLRPAGQSDDLAHTVDYGAVARAVAEIGQGPSVKLVETLAERAAERLLADYPAVHAVTVEIAKLHPPVPLVVAACSVRIRRERSPAGG